MEEEVAQNSPKVAEEGILDFLKSKVWEALWRKAF